MAIGRRGVITGFTYPDPTGLLTVKDDPVLPAAGALMLFDASLLDGGAPAPGASLFNAAWRQARTALGSGDATTLGAAYKRSTDFAAADGLIERTPKGGIHFLVSQSTMTAGRGGAVELPDAIKSYILANPGHGFYLSSWLKLTRAVSGTPGAHRIKLARAGNNYTSAFKALLYRNNTTLTGATPSGSGNGIAGIPSLRVATGAVAGDVQRIAFGQNGPIASPYYGTLSGGTVVSPPTGIADMEAGFLWGSMSASNQGSGSHLQQPSQVLYRLYFEDLTLSGRTAAAVDALDAAAHAAAFGTGGRFAGDTYTNPSTLP